MLRKSIACVFGALPLIYFAAPLAPAQDADVTGQVERAFELLGLDEGGPATTDPARIAEGLPLLEAAAVAGEGVAQNALGMAYANGFFGLEVDIERAIALFEDAMDSGLAVEPATLNWALAQYQFGDAAAAVVRLEEMYTSDSELAPYAAGTLAEAYAIGKGVTVDLPRAGALYEAAVELDPGNSQAHYMLGRGYEAGFFEGGAQAERALTHYQSAADLGDPRAAWRIGMAHLDGKFGFEGGAEEAYSWVLRSAEGGWIQGMISTAVMLATGDGVEMDKAAAADWYTEAAALGSAHAMRGLGAMHFFEEFGRESDRDLGLALLELAAESGDEMAPSLLDSTKDQRRGIDREEVDRLKSEWRQRLAAAP